MQTSRTFPHALLSLLALTLMVSVVLAADPGLTFPPSCQTICFRSPQYWLLNLTGLPSGTVLIGGVNSNAPINSDRIDDIRLALRGGALATLGSSPLQQLNREFTAAQLNLNAVGGASSAVGVNALWSPLSCYGLFFAPVTLSNGLTLTPDKVLNDLFEQARLAIQENRTAEMPALTVLFHQLNGDDPLNRCHQGGSAPNQPHIFNGPLIFDTVPESAIKPACGCNESTHNQGISLVAQSCPKCETIGGYQGIGNDTGGRTVFLHNGEFFHHVVDLEIPGRGFDWKFERKYRSGITFDGPLGHNWEFNYNRRLFVERDNSVLRMDGMARADRYLLIGSSYQSPLGFYTQLKRTPDGGFIELDRSGTRVTYSAPDAVGIARMTELQDRNGNRMRFEYNLIGQLVRVIDTLGRPIVYRYNERRLIEIEDFSGRKLRFGYDAQGNLISVTSPAVTGTPNGNDFPAGKTTFYRYSSGFSDERLNHNLIEIIAPNEAAASGPPRVQIEYQTDSAQPGLLDRVLRQTIGGLNASGISAGGTISYEYSFLGDKRKPGMPPPDENTPIFQTTVIDRNGNRTEYQFNPLGNILQVREFTNRDIRAGDPEFFETRYEYNNEGEMTRYIKPEGTVVEYVYDHENPDRFQQGNLLSETTLPGPRGGDQAFIRITRTYEPIYNQVRTTTEARGNDPNFAPQNGGSPSPDRYTTTYIFDYQEGNNVAALADLLGVGVSEVMQRLSQAGIQTGLGDVNGDGLVSQVAGNVVKVAHPTVTLLSGSNMAQIEGSTSQPIVESYSYNSFGQLISHRDQEGNVTLRAYHPENDPDGDGVNQTPGVSNGPLGYLKEEIRDAVSSSERNSKTNPAPAMIRRQFFYDAVGNVIREIDGRGIETRYAVNQLNQVVQIIRAADVSQARANSEEPNWNGCSDQSLIECSRGMVAFAYLINIFYDHNNNVIRRETENRDSNNQSLAGNSITSSFAYDILDKVLEERQEVSENQFLTKRFRYDHNENRVLEISPVAVAGTQPSNVVSFVFDERDLLFTSTRGGLTSQFKNLASNTGIPELSQIPNSPNISTFTRSYDLNRNLVSLVDGADNDGDDRPEATVFQHDGFDRRVRATDAVGNQEVTSYDPAGNVVRISHFGKVSGTSANSQTLLSQVEHKYDELSRMFERNDRLFVYQGVTYTRQPILQDGPLGQANDGLVTTRYEYDRLSRQTFMIEDDLDTRRTFFDGVNRAVRKIDPEANETLYAYDDDNNLIRAVEVEVTQRSDVQAGKVSNLRETFTTINVYDALNRLIRTTDNIGQTSRHHYDSRGNLIFASDAQHSKDAADLIADPLGLLSNATKLNRAGNTTQLFYDGINRKLTEVRALRVDGQGKNAVDTSNPANADGLIIISQVWDANSRLSRMTDDKGNATNYLYDDLNRRQREVFADGTANSYTYDADNNLVQMVDENGSVIRHSYDGINRLVHNDVTRASGVIGTTRQEFEYDGLSRLTRSFDNNDPTNLQDDATVTFAYDSLSRLLEEVQNGQAVSGRWAGDNNRLGLVYPNGREIKLTYDHLDRIDTIRDPGGATITPPPIVDYDYIGAGRVLERTYANGVRLTYLDNPRQQDVGYDGLKRTVLHRHLRADQSLVAAFVYEYDRANNKQSEVKQHTANLREDYRYDSNYRLGQFARQGEMTDTWQLDGVGNWDKRKDVINQANNMNEYTLFAGVPQQYDSNGNLIDGGSDRDSVKCCGNWFPA